MASEENEYVLVCYYCNTTVQSQTDVTANETSRYERARRGVISRDSRPSDPAVRKVVSTIDQCVRVREDRNPFLLDIFKTRVSHTEYTGYMK